MPARRLRRGFLHARWCVCPNTRGRSRVYAEHRLGSQSLSSRRKPIEEFDNAVRIWGSPSPGRVAWGLLAIAWAVPAAVRRWCADSFAAQGLWVPVHIEYRMGAALRAARFAVRLDGQDGHSSDWHRVPHRCRAWQELDSLEPVPVPFAGAHPLFPGLDQVNVALPRSLAAAEQVNVSLNVASTTSNVVTVTIR